MPRMVAEEAPGARERIEQQLAKQVAHRLEQLSAAGDKRLVDKSGNKPDALVLPFFAHRAADRRAVQLVKRRGKRAHIRVRHCAAPQHAGQKRRKARRLFLQRRDELNALRTGLEFFRLDIIEIRLRRDLASDWFHCRPPMICFFQNTTKA